MAQYLTLEVGADGTVEWPPDGTFEVPPNLAERMKGHPWGTLLHMTFDYRRLGARDKRYTLTTVKVEPLAERAWKAWLRCRGRSDSPLKATLDDLLPCLEQDPTVLARGVRACIAADEGDFSEVPDAITALIAEEGDRDDLVCSDLVCNELLEALPRPNRLPHEVRAAIVERVWDAPGRWTWIDKNVESAYRGLEERYPYPLHFGGPKVREDRPVVFDWVDARLDALMDASTRAALRELRGRATADLAARFDHAEQTLEERNEAAHAAAYDAWSRRNPDGIDSPPDDFGTDHALDFVDEWCAYAVAARGDGPRWGGLGQWLVRRAGEQALPVALAFDAVVILSATEPSLAPLVRRVVYVRAERTRGHALVVLSDERLCELVAPEGWFGSWQVRVLERTELSERMALSLEQPSVMVDPASFRAPYAVRRAESSGRALSEQSEPEPVRWVRSKRFGRGLVVGSIPGPKGKKLVIEFEAEGRKVLHHSFVEDE